MVSPNAPHHNQLHHYRHTLLEVHKRLAGEGLGRDQLLAVVEQGIGTGRNYRVPTSQEFDDASRAADLLACERAFLTGLPAVPDERIPDNNGATIRPQLYGAVTYGDLMCARQTLATVRLARIISTMAVELLESGNSADYVHALAGYAAANLVRKIRYSTRGATIHLTRQGVGDIFLNEGAIGFSYDFLEVGIGGGAGSWESLAEGYVSTLRLALAKSTGIPTTIVRGSATSLPWADNRFTAVVTDPPYDSMVYYADSSDLLYVWVKRALSSVRPDLAITPDVNGLQDKTEEIIVKEHGKSEHEHRDRAHYDRLIAVAFREMRRVVQNDGVVTIVFGHGEPEVWRRLLGAISQANLVMTGSWPANTESGGQQGKANIETTLTMSCRPASVDRAEGRKANVEAEIRSVVKSRVPDWERWGLAPTDMLMAAAGPAMEVVGKYSEVLDARGEPVDIATFLPLARAAVQEAMAVEVDHHPLETFDARTRFALWWVRLYGRQTVAKSELRWQALAASLELADVRDLIPDIDKGCRFTASNGPLARPTPESAVIDVALAMSSAFGEGLEAVGEVLTRSGRDVDDGYLWAAMAFLADRLPSTDPDVIAWTGILRNRSGVGSAARALVAADARAAEADKQLRLL